MPGLYRCSRHLIFGSIDGITSRRTIHPTVKCKSHVLIILNDLISITTDQNLIKTQLNVVNSLDQSTLLNSLAFNYLIIIIVSLYRVFQKSRNKFTICILLKNYKIYKKCTNKVPNSLKKNMKLNY